MKFITLFLIPFMVGVVPVRFRQHNSMDPKQVIETVRTAFPHAVVNYQDADSVFVVDNFVNFDAVYFTNRMQQFGVIVTLIEGDEK